MTRAKGTGKRERGVRKRMNCETLKEAIENKQKSFKGRKILYLNTVLGTGMYKGEFIVDVILRAPRYVEFLTTTNVYVTDEVIEKLKEKIQL